MGIGKTDVSSIMEVICILFVAHLEASSEGESWLAFKVLLLGLEANEP